MCVCVGIDLGGALRVGIQRVAVGNRFYLTVMRLRLVQSPAAGQRNEAALRVLRVVVPDAVVVVLRANRSAARQLHTHTGLGQLSPASLRGRFIEYQLRLG